MAVRARFLVVALIPIVGLVALAGPVTAAIRPTGAARPTSAAPPVPLLISRGVRIPAFYVPPAALSRTHGTLIRTEPLRLAVRLPGLAGSLPGRATRLMYTTTDSSGRPVAVTGTYLEPARPWPGPGPRPLAVVAPGTMGQGDQCAASLGLERPVIVSTQSASAGYDDVAVYRLLIRGVAVVLTDYVGLGTTDRLHTYVNRVDEAHAVLDAVRAARALKGTSVTSRSRIGLYGYSQGGGATAAAAELQPGYAPDVHLAGTYAGAPPADLAQVTRAIDGSDLAAALGWAINGLVQSYPAVRTVVAQHLNATGRTALLNASTMCVGEGVLSFSGTHSTSWTTDGRSVTQVVDSEPVLQAVFAAQRIGTMRPSGPVRVASGVHDNLVPHAQARAMAVSWCREGGDVTYAPINLPGLGRALPNHFAALLADQGKAISWLTDRLSGKPTGSNCRTISLLP